MTDSSNDFLMNLVGALSLALADAQRRTCEVAAGHGAAAPAALIAVEQYPNETVGFFDSILGLTSSGTVRLFDRLVDAGLIQKRSGADARTRAVALTPAGQKAAGAVRTARRSIVADAVACLSDAETRQLEPIAAKLLASLPSTRSQARNLCRLCDHSNCDDTGKCPVDLAVTAAGCPHCEP